MIRLVVVQMMMKWQARKQKAGNMAVPRVSEKSGGIACEKSGNIFIRKVKIWIVSRMVRRRIW